jgi:hypothetical protein
MTAGDPLKPNGRGRPRLEADERTRDCSRMMAIRVYGGKRAMSSPAKKRRKKRRKLAKADE